MSSQSSKTFFIALLLTTTSVLAHEPDKNDKFQLEPVIITATRSEKPLSELPYSASAIKLDSDRSKTIYRTVPEALKYEPGIMVQKTAHGQGSPHIRGFTGFRTLFLVDGIRLNNSVWRDGPNQYVNTVDPYSLSKIEVVKGPSSAIYGSDAIGGTVNLISRGNQNTETGFNLRPSLYYRYGDAENSHSGHAEASANYDDKLGVLLGLSYKDYGDVIGGDQVGLQPDTGYRDMDVNFKSDYALTPDSRLTFAHQHVRLDDAWRTHSTFSGISWRGTEVGSDQARILDQQRELTYLKYQGKNFNTLIDTLNATVSFQQQDEDEHRVQTKNKIPSKISDQGFETGTLGLTLQASTLTDLGNWTYGVEYYHDDVDSHKRNFDGKGQFVSHDIQGPVADDSTYDLFDVYAQNEYALLDPLDLIVGGRYTHAAVHAGKLQDPFSKRQTSFSDSWDNLAGSARLLYHVDQADRWKVFGGVSQGFRAPNLSDLTRLDTALSGEKETSALNLKPEQYISYEFGLKTDYENGSTQLAYFYTDIDNMILRTPTGNIVDGKNEVTKKNSGRGHIQGLEFGGSYNFLLQWTAFSSATWTDGRIMAFPTQAPVEAQEPITRMMPITANFGLRWDSPTKNYWLEGLITIAGGQHRLSSSDIRDTQRIPPGGTPGYTVYNLRGGWTIHKNVDITLALENIGDKDYRIHGSGINEPGRNFLAGIGMKF